MVLHPCVFFLLDTRCKSSIKYTYETRRCDYQDQTRELTQAQGDCCLAARNYALRLRAAYRCRIGTDYQAGKEVAMNRSHVIRLNPTPEQEVYFRKACGVARHAYNWALARWKEYRVQGKWAKMNDLKTEYNRIKGEQFPWCYEVTKCAPEQAFDNLGQAFANYWRMKKEGTLPKLKHPRKDGEEGGFPHFKSKKRDRLSFYLANDKFSMDGIVFENQKHYRRGLGRIKGLSKGLSRKGEGSQNWGKTTKKLAKAHYRVSCQRQDSLHKMTTHVARTHALIGLEDLNAKGMLANHSLAQAVSDASFFEVKRQLLYKAEQHGGYVQLLSQWYPSSKTCHECGWIKEDLTLADRVFICEQCGVVLDRDYNASLNIRDEALRLVTDVPAVASSERKFACGAGSSGSEMGETFCCEAGTKVL